MRDPPHPGEVLGSRLSGVSVTAAAKLLGVPRKALSDILNRRSGVSADMAIRLEEADLGGADFWLGIHLEYNLWKARIRAVTAYSEALKKLTEEVDPKAYYYAREKLRRANMLLAERRIK